MRVHTTLIMGGFLTGFLALLSSPATAAEQSCEVVTFETVTTDGVDKRVGKFHDGGPVLDTLYDDKDGFLSFVNGEPIVAILCEREDLLPRLRDLPIVKTGWSFSLSQDFDAPDSGLLTIVDNGDAYTADYVGPDALGPDKADLADVMDIFNLQRLTE